MELDSDTEAVVREGFKLGCISCKRRGEVLATASVNWYFKASDETEFSHVSTEVLVLCNYLKVHILGTAFIF